MLTTTLSQFVLILTGIVLGTLVLAGLWAGVENVLPKLKGYFARMN